MPVDTGSRADGYISEELSSNRQHGAAPRPRPGRAPGLPRRGLTGTSTRREELLLRPAELPGTLGARRGLCSRDGAPSALETRLERMREPPGNAAFLRRVQPTLPGR